MTWCSRFAAVLLGALLTTQAFASPKRVALVVGITDYPGADRLEAAVLDARLISKQLRSIGFQVTEATNGSYRDLTEDLADFAAEASDADVALFYYAGHGFEVAGENFLMPVDIGKPMASMDQATVRMRGLPLSTVLREVSAANPRALVAVIDACRDAPTRGATGGGMSVPDIGDGTFIAYSTRPGERAIDSAASLGHAKRNSPFALYFAENLAQPEMSVLALMEATQSQVDAFTQGRQRPWFSSALNGPVVLNAAAPAAASASPLAALMGNGQKNSPLCPPERAEAARLWNTEMRAVEVEVLELDADRLTRLTARAKGGEARAMTALGLAHERGSGVPQSRARAKEFWRKAADDGYVIAMTLLGEALYEETASERGRRDARKLLEQASNAGFARATLDLLDFEDTNEGLAEQLSIAFCQGIQGINR